VACRGGGSHDRHVPDPWDQRAAAVRCEWGPAGAARLLAAGDVDVLVVVDVLSFTTAVTVAVERGTAVLPAAWHDPRAEALARSAGAVLAVGRGEATAARPWSLSPAALRAAPAVPRLVLPSPNGSAISAAAAASGAVVVAACLRNAGAVAAEVGRRGGVCAVLPAGERWPDGSLRPALEDLLGAGAVIAGLAGALSAEAAAARAVFAGTPSVPDAVRSCGSGRELVERGFGADVEIAVEVDACVVVPVLSGAPAAFHDQRGIP
jgi:2-phosphosulfolactate phosphatase